MDDCTVGANARNRVKRWLDVVLAMSSEVVDHAGSRILIHSMVWLFEFLFKERKVFHDRRTVPDVCSAHASLLNFVFACFNVLDDVIIQYDGHLFNHTDNIGIACLRVNTNTFFLRF